jgi:hypothetical protein
MRAAIVAFLVLVVVAGLAAFLWLSRPQTRAPEPLVPTVPSQAERQPGLSPAVATGVVTTRLALLDSPTPMPTATASPAPPTVAAPTVAAPSPSATLAAATAALIPTATTMVAITPTPLPPSPIPPSRTPTATAARIGISTWGLPASAQGRVGVGVPLQGIGDFDWGDTPPGWYLNWTTQPQPTRRTDVAFARMIRLNGSRFSPALDQIKATAAAAPGALWLIGNEPDVPWQDNATPEQYAVSYGVLHAAIKEADPTAHVAIGGVSQPTPLRLAYLDLILAAYRARYGAEMPVDVWNVHAFILREERNSWGVGIPPGMPVDKGTLYEIDHHTDMQVFRQQIVAFRRWMAERGQRNKPLVVTEYGVLMPEDYGFPPDLVSKFMAATFDYFLSAQDTTLGYEADGNRLVQAFCWYSVADTMYPTSNLFDAQTRAITPVGLAFKQTVQRLR